MTLSKTTSQGERHKAEAAFLQGNGLVATQPDRALQHYERAVKLLLQAVELTKADQAALAQYSLQAATLAFQGQQRRLGWHYQQIAEQAARQSEERGLLVDGLLVACAASIQEGQYQKALERSREGERAATSPSQRCQLRTYRASIGYLAYDDKGALRALQAADPPPDGVEAIYYHLTYGWLLAFQYQTEEATHQWELARDLAGGDEGLVAPCQVLGGLITAQQGAVTAAIAVLLSV